MARPAAYSGASAALGICGQPIAEDYPAHVVRQPRMMRRRIPARIVERTRGDIDLAWARCRLVSQRSAAGRAECALNRIGRRELCRLALDESKVALIDSDPCDGRRSGNAP